MEGFEEDLQSSLVFVMEEEGRKRLRKQQGMPREVAVRRKVPPEPRLGGSRGYDHYLRRQDIALQDQGLQTTASARSVRRWRVRLNSYRYRCHHYHNYHHYYNYFHRMTGNKGQMKMSNYDTYLLIMYRMIYPKAQADEVRRFIFENNLENPVIYSRVDITNVEKLLDMTRVRGSTTAHQALLPHNLLRRFMFWNRPPPVGVFGVNRNRLVDIDECGIFLTTANRNYGKCYKGLRVRESGPYGYDEKWTLILGVMADGFRHAWFRRVGGTNAIDFHRFVQEVIARLNRPDALFMWDNLTSHFSAPLILDIYQAGCELVPRAPYYPIDGPIAYVFDTFENALKSRLYLIRNEVDLLNNVHDILRRMGGFQNYFIHCGF